VAGIILGPGMECHRGTTNAGGFPYLVPKTAFRFDLAQLTRRANYLERIPVSAKKVKYEKQVLFFRGREQT
jgi:hypothetical protein